MEGQSKNLPSVGILGCGWLGFPFAKTLIELGVHVAGTTTSIDKLGLLGTAKIQASLFNAGADKVPKTILDKEVLIIAFPPKSKSTDGEWYWKAIRDILNQIQSSSIKKVILISSTSVYPETPGEVSEEYELNIRNTGNSGLYLAEKCVLEAKIPAYVLRFGGLTGGNRLLAKHFAGKTNLKNGNFPVNLVHLDDAISILCSFLLTDFETGVFNICSPIHPSKKELYTNDCRRFNLPLPGYSDDENSGKKIFVKKLLDTTGYQFKFPDPLTYNYTI